MLSIIKSGFYKLSEIYSEDINIDKDITVIVFDDLGKSVKFSIEENSKLEIYGFIQNIDNFNLEVISKKERSNLKIRYLLLSGEYEKTFVRIKSGLVSSFSKSDVKILSIVKNGGEIDLDGIIDIGKGLEKVDGHLLEENIFLGTSGKIRGVPSLLVASNDVKASHACRIEKISDEKLFYLRSRGVGKYTALSMMVESYVVDLFNCLSMVDEDFYRKLIDGVLGRLNKY